MAQRLMRKVCPNCVTDYQPADKELQLAGISKEEAKQINFKKGVGCVHCDNTGYKGRTGIFEMLELNSEIRKLIFEGKNQDIIREKALENGMETLHDAAVERMKLGITSIQEVIKLTISD
jgi:type II secretory ATPase GspE/PulE/Tfp pilus assembly ATPase PilB-like protein